MTAITPRTLKSVRAVVGPGPSPGGALAADPGQWLPAPARRCGLDRWTVDLAAGPLTRPVACHVGTPWQIGDATWRTITWEPRSTSGDVVAGERVLPSLCGELGLQADGDGAVLRLHATYAPPGGVLGAVFDAAALHGVAQATADRFLADIAGRLTGAADEDFAQAPPAGFEPAHPL